MSKPSDYRTAVRESMDRVDELFGRKTQATDKELEVTKNRRLQDVSSRAHNEKFGFLQSLKKKVFGKKAPEPEFKRDERSEDERRAAVLDRARRN